MSGYRCFMRSVKLNFLLVLFLVFGLAYQGYADCPYFVESSTELEAAGNKTGKGFWSFITFQWNKLDFDEKLLQYIKVKAVENQGVDGYFNPRIEVCDYEWDGCKQLYSGTSCHKVYGTQSTGAGISAAVFIDWEGNKMLDGGKIHSQIGQGLEWEWADGVTKEEQEKFANSPKICACSQKGACMSGVSSWGANFFSGENIFENKRMEDVCDTCYQTTVKCVPVPLAPGPPPLCEQLAMSPPQVRIVPITNEKNDYFDPKVKVMAGDLIDAELDFPKGYGKDKPKKHHILDKDGTTHYFTTYREKDKLCAEYRGTEREESKLQFPARCFPVPPAPEPQIVNVVDENTLKIEIRMSKENCMKQINRSYKDGYCTFDVNFDVNESKGKIDPRSFRVIKPRMIKKTANDGKNYITDIIEGVLRKNPQFEILEKYGLTPNVGIKLPGGKEYSITNPKKTSENLSKLELDDMGQLKRAVRYMRVKNQGNSKSKLLCLSGWKPEPEGFVIKRESEIIPLKLMGARYIKYNSVYSKESNQFYYLPSKEKEIVDLLQKPQEKLNDMIFNKQGYVFFPDENKQEKGKCSYCVEEDSKIDEAFQSGKGLKVVYKLIDAKYEEPCNQGEDGCLCFDGGCGRLTQYVDKDDKPFYLRYEEVDCKDKNGEILKNEEGEIRKCTQLKDQPIKANRTEVFYADRLCRLDLAGLKNRLREIIVKQLKDKKQKLEESRQGSYGLGDGYTDDLSQYDYIEIEAWGGGEAGHIKDKAQSTESRPGMPGDYIKVQLKIDPNYPIIKAKATEGGGGQEDYISNKDGGPTFIEMCKNASETDCKLLITVAGGGTDRTYGGRNYKDTVIHEQNLKLKEKVMKVNKLNSSEDNKIAYIENGEIKYKNVTKCDKSDVDDVLDEDKTYGAGGCINKSNGIYNKGFPGHVKIKPMFNEVDESKINDAVEKMIQDPDDITGIDDSLINKLDKKIIDTIKKEIKKELLGYSKKNRSSENSASHFNN